jgi:hypothetical protein
MGATRDVHVDRGAAIDAGRRVCLELWEIDTLQSQVPGDGPPPRRGALTEATMSIDLTKLDASESARLAEEGRAALAGAGTLEGASAALCRHLHAVLAGPDGDRACALVRSYATHAYGALPFELQRFAKRMYGTMAITPPEFDMRCLVLLATAGDEPAWNDRRQSHGHQAIPLPTPHVVERAPMIAQLVREIGLDVAHVIRPTPAVLRAFPEGADGVFHVEDAVGSPYIPAQEEFVLRHGIRSVVGFGGPLPTGELFATILFARVRVPVDAADRLREVGAALGRSVQGLAGRVFGGGA